MSNAAATNDTFEAVRYAVTVPLPPDQAFALFTDGYNSWWPGHHVGTAEMAEAVLEARAGGRFYQRGVDGSECEWGKVLACETPHRIVVAWQITATDDDWVYDPDPAHASELEVNFREQPDGRTLVELEHRNIGRHGPG
ncbi:MAG: SRPBCC family protein, partial [Actinobacteria bacterium]|nr:SRPBCC family protein [Actinomycetota bacterium]